MLLKLIIKKSSLGAELTHQLVAFPYASQCLAARVEDSWAIHEISVEGACEVVSVCEVEGSLAFLHVLAEHSYITFLLTFKLRPALIHIIEVSRVEWSLHRLGELIVKNTLTAKLIVLPLTLISDLTALVVELSAALHFVSNPVSIIESTILVEELAFSVTQVIDLFAFVSSTILEVINDVDWRRGTLFSSLSELADTLRAVMHGQWCGVLGVLRDGSTGWLCRHMGRSGHHSFRPL